VTLFPYTTLFRSISPAIGHLFVASNFSNRVIKSFPNVAIMDREEYQKYRGGVFLKKVDDVGVMIGQTQDKASSLSAMINENKIKLEYDEKLVKQIYAKQDKDFYQCLDKNVADICESLKSEGTDVAITTNKEIEDLNKQIAGDEKLLEEYGVYTNFLESQKKVGVALSANIPMERGAFDPPDKIRLTLGSTDSHAVADYFETLTHEYLHYASYVSEEKKFNDPFFEEGLTEYYARMAIKNNLDISTNLGYPAAAIIMAKMVRRIPDSELADIYFSKDQNGLEKLLDRVYGDNFYKNNIILFDTLQYTTDQRQLLLLANMIMTKIGGNQLTAKDLLSTFSNLN
jgi:hypothetical protein